MNACIILLQPGRKIDENTKYCNYPDGVSIEMTPHFSQCTKTTFENYVKIIIVCLKGSATLTSAFISTLGDI